MSCSRISVIASLITEDPDILIELDSRNIYNYYGMLGAGIPLDECSHIIESMYAELIKEFRSTIIQRSIGGVFYESYTESFPSKEYFVSSGGRPETWDKVFAVASDYLEHTSKARDDDEEFSNFNEDNNDPWVWNGEYSNDDNYDDNDDEWDIKWPYCWSSILDDWSVFEKLDDYEIDCIFDVLDNIGGSMYMSGRGQWFKLWNIYKDNVNAKSLREKIIAIELMITSVHHGGEMVRYMFDDPEESSLALDRKFEAESISDFWGNISGPTKVLINKFRRSYGLSIIS